MLYISFFVKYTTYNVEHALIMNTFALFQPSWMYKENKLSNQQYL